MVLAERQMRCEPGGDTCDEEEEIEMMAEAAHQSALVPQLRMEGGGERGKLPGSLGDAGRGEGYEGGEPGPSNYPKEATCIR